MQKLPFGRSAGVIVEQRISDSLQGLVISLRRCARSPGFSPRLRRGKWWRLALGRRLMQDTRRSHLFHHPLDAVHKGSMRRYR